MKYKILSGLSIRFRKGRASKPVGTSCIPLHGIWVKGPFTVTESPKKM